MKQLHDLTRELEKLGEHLKANQPSVAERLLFGIKLEARNLEWSEDEEAWVSEDYKVTVQRLPVLYNTGALDGVQRYAFKVNGILLSDPTGVAFQFHAGVLAKTLFRKQKKAKDLLKEFA